MMREQTPTAALAGSEGVVPYSVDGRGGVYKNHVPVPALLSLAEGAEGLVDGESLRVKDLVVAAQMKASSVPPLLGPPDAYRPLDAVVLSRAVRPIWVLLATSVKTSPTISRMIYLGGSRWNPAWGDRRW